MSRTVTALLGCLNASPPPLVPVQQGGASHMSGVLSHQGLGQQSVHPAPGGGPQMQGQWRQPLGGQQAPPHNGEKSSETCDPIRLDILGLEMYRLEDFQVDVENPRCYKLITLLIRHLI